ncbi:hypothetical protein [Micromonospora sp. CPCC 206061]|uniref:hypothetical protein n=1 Tax=Micromonospora sp. CPCC 206061 TaxID=3122410 RepID=UPI002FEF526A
MIVGSLLLILVAVTLLVLGLANGSSTLLISSIAGSLLAAVALVVGARQAAAARADAGYGDDERKRAGDEDEHEWEHRRAATTQTRMTEPVGRRAGRLGGGDGPVFTPPARSAPALGGSPVALAEQPAPPFAEPAYAQPVEAPTPPHGLGVTEQQPVIAAEVVDDEDPPDEPAPQYVSPADAARVARMTADVLVIDGRPRYHLTGCVHLLGRESEALPVGEAVELGFTPCGRCEPDSALLADARRV